MWTPINDLLLTAIVAVMLTAAVALSTAPPPRERAWMWQQVVAVRVAHQQAEVRRNVQLRIAHATNYWAQFQREVLAELAQAPALPPAAAGAPNPDSAIPPLYLYHSTPRRNLASIYARGLEGRNQGVTFMFRNYAAAQTYAERRAGGEYVIFRVHSQRAYQNGVSFERRGDDFVADFIHPEFLDFHWLLADLAHRENLAA